MQIALLIPETPAPFILQLKSIQGQLHSLQQKSIKCLFSSQEVNMTLPGSVTQEWIQVTHSSPAPACRTVSRPVSSWASQLGRVPSGAVICDNDGWNLMPRLPLLDNYFLELCQGNITYLFFTAAYFEPREISFPLYPRVGYYQPSWSKAQFFIAWYAAWGFKESSKYISFFSPRLKLFRKRWPGALITVFLSLLISMGLY